ncbi:MAG: His/Gly/Thr/Pro-type tRNA ligase C-terminal domain-containing protein [Patescibacteria group bacterium]
MTDQKSIPPDREVKEVSDVNKIARFYGFKSILPPSIEKQDFDAVKDFEESSHPEEKAAILRMYFEEKIMSQSQPSMFYCERPFPKSKEKKKTLRLEGSLISLGSGKSVCECLSIQAGIAILNEIGHKNIEVQINSIGDKDSISDFQKKLTVFVRKNFNVFPADLRQASKKDLCAVLKENKCEWQNFQDECPKSIDFLSEASRLHFKEVLEFLEIMNIPYQINNHLVGDIDIGSETIFSIKDVGEEKELAHGFCFNKLAKKIGHKKDLSCCILNISAHLKKPFKKVKAKQIKPQFYLIQFSPEAKLKSFIVLEELNKAGASVLHSITKDKLGSQINTAENSGVPYIILIGQKEALDNCVIIRNNTTHAQETVSIPNLAVRVKEIIKSL